MVEAGFLLFVGSDVVEYWGNGERVLFAHNHEVRSDEQHRRHFLFEVRRRDPRRSQRLLCLEKPRINHLGQFLNILQEVPVLAADDDDDVCLILRGTRK